jgi:lipopolysaccharide export system permease protein
VFGNIIQRMIFREIAKVFVLSLLGITGILLMAGIVAEATQQGLSPGQILAIIPLLIPSTLPYTIPATTLFATCVVYGRLAADNEILAIKAAGINIRMVVWPAVLLGVLMSATTMGLYYHLIPYTHSLMRSMFLNDVEESLYAVLRKDHAINQPRLNYAMWVRQVQGRKLLNALFKRRDAKGDYDVVAWAREAELRVNITNKQIILHMRNGLVSIEGGTSGYFADKFWEVELPQLFDSTRQRRPRSMTWPDCSAPRNHRKIVADTRRNRATEAQIAAGTAAPDMPQHVKNLEERRQTARMEICRGRGTVHAAVVGVGLFVLRAARLSHGHAAVEERLSPARSSVASCPSCCSTTPSCCAGQTLPATATAPAAVDPCGRRADRARRAGAVPIAGAELTMGVLDTVPSRWPASLDYRRQPQPGPGDGAGVRRGRRGLGTGWPRSRITRTGSFGTHAAGRRVDILSDLFTPTAVEQMCAEVLAPQSDPHLVNNVGGRRENIATEKMPLADWQRFMDLNLTSAFLCTKLLGGPMLERRSGRIINIASICSQIATRNIHGRHYETAKTALLGFTRAWLPTGRFGVTVNAIGPGAFLTDPNRRLVRRRPGSGPRSSGRSRWAGSANRMNRPAGPVPGVGCVVVHHRGVLRHRQRLHALVIGVGRRPRFRAVPDAQILTQVVAPDIPAASLPGSDASASRAASSGPATPVGASRTDPARAARPGR